MKKAFYYLSSHSAYPRSTLRVISLCILANKVSFTRGWADVAPKRVVTSGKGSRDLLLHMPPVQFATLMSLPWQGRPPWLGGGSSQDLLLVCVQSVPHTDHADHLDHPPSTTVCPREKKKETNGSKDRLSFVRSLKGTRIAVKAMGKKLRGNGTARLVTRPYPHEPFSKAILVNSVARTSLPFRLIDSYRPRGKKQSLFRMRSIFGHDSSSSDAILTNDSFPRGKSFSLF